MSALIDHAVNIVSGLRSRMFSFEKVSKDVEAGLFTAAVKGILLYHIHCTKHLVTYGDLADATSSMPHGGQLAQALKRIAEDDHQKKRPLSTAVVVSNERHFPGEGFFKQCEELGYQVGHTPEEHLLFWRTMLNKLGVLPVMSDIAGEYLDTLASQTGKNLAQDSELEILSGLWSEERRLARGPMDKEDETKVILPKAPSTAQSILRDDAPEGVPLLSSEEQRKRVMAESAFVHVPAHHVKEGDVLINPTNVGDGADEKVSGVDIQTVFKNGRATRLVTLVTEKGTKFLSDELIHFRVRRPEHPQDSASSLPGTKKARRRR